MTAARVELGRLTIMVFLSILTWHLVLYFRSM